MEKGSETAATMDKHVLLLTINAKGHGLPMVQLGRALMESYSNCRVSVLWPMTAADASKFDRSKIETERMHLEILDGSEEYFLKSNELEALVEDTLPAINRSREKFGPIKAAVVDFWFWNNKWLGEATQSPVWTFYTSPLSLIVITFRYDGERENVPAGGEHLPCHGNIVKTDFAASHSGFAMYEFLRKIMPDQKYSQGIIVNDAAEWYNEEFNKLLVSCRPPDVADSWTMKCVGPLATFDTRATMASSLPATDDDKVMSWLNAQPPKSVVYVALGSVWVLPWPDLKELALGLGACGKKVLWAHRSPKPKMLELVGFGKKRPDDVDEVTGLPVGYNPPNVHVTTWVNQVAVLTHPSVATFMTHCGWNSTLEALTLAGLPLLALPISADQFVIAKFLTNHLEVAVQLWAGAEVDDLTAVRVSEAISTVMAHDHMKFRAKTVQEMLLKTTVNGDSYEAFHSVFDNIA